MSKADTLMASGKRRRAAEDEAYLDNYHNHKRFLTEVMASSMNGLSVSDTVTVNRRLSSPSVDPMPSPAPSETPCTLSRSASSFPSQGDETSTVDSFMSEDSDESVGYRFSQGAEAPQFAAAVSTDLPSGPAPSMCSPSPRRFQKLQCHGPGQPAPLPWISGSRTQKGLCHEFPMTPQTPAWPRCPDTEGRLPPSPNDQCAAPDLRRATLLRNLSMRAQLPNQPTFSSTAADVKLGNKSAQELETLEEGADQSSINSIPCHFYAYAPDATVMGSPTHGVFPGHVVRGSSRARSLILGEEKVRPETLLTTDVATSNEGDDLMAKEDQRTSIEGEVLYKRSPRGPKDLSTAASSTGYEILSCLSPKDGNVSDTESTFSRRSVRSAAGISRQSSVCSHSDSSFPGRGCKADASTG